MSPICKSRAFNEQINTIIGTCISMQSCIMDVNVPTTLYILALPSLSLSFNFIQTIKGSTEGEAAGYMYFYPAHACATRD